MSKKIRTEAVDRLFDAILSLETREECYIFFEDICTVNELLSLSQRFEVAKMLRDQKTYLDIAEKLLFSFCLRCQYVIFVSTPILIFSAIFIASCIGIGFKSILNIMFLFSSVNQT